MQYADKYLQNYAEPEAVATRLSSPTFDYCLIVPCYNESPGFAQRLMQSRLWLQNLLVIVVINQPPGAVTVQNEQLNTFFKQFRLLWQQQNMRLFQPEGNSAFLVVDAFDAKTLPADRGVGLARKIGCDIALSLNCAGHIKTPWLFNTDADARLPENYFSAVSAHPDAGAICYRFKHTPAHDNSLLNTATALYDKAIRYFAEGLRWAGSPYGFTALGSALAIKMEGYCAVRGFPQKSGGEDFYLLNKIAKIASVANSDLTVCIESRHSSRVPFGTGPAVARIEQLLAEQKPYTYYNPECFVALQATLLALTNIWNNTDQPQRTLLSTLQTQLSPAAYQALLSTGFEKAVTHINRQCNTHTQAVKAVHVWLDGFKTLKFIRALQTLAHPALPLSDCLSLAPWRPDGGTQA